VLLHAVIHGNGFMALFLAALVLLVCVAVLISINFLPQAQRPLPVLAAALMEGWLSSPGGACAERFQTQPRRRSGLSGGCRWLESSE